MANKTFNTRVKNKRDTAANWEAVATTFQPLDGELIIVDTAAGKTRFKVGRYDTAKGRLLYYNEIPFTDEYLYNDLNESQGKIYDKLKGIDDKSIIEMTLESVFDNTKFINYRIGLWQFPKTGFYKLNISKRGTTETQLMLYAQKTKEDGTTPEDPFSQDNLLRISPLTGDKQVESVFVQVDYTDTDTLTVYKVQFLNVMTFPGTININTYNKTTQKWDFTSVTESSAKWANNATKVSNAITLTKGDTTTKFDGSTAQAVEIPTKTSELTNDSFVSYTEQALTKDQQNQAKTNLGIDVLTGNTTTVTPTQVKEAILAGRPVAITYTDTIYGNLTFTSFGYSVENNVVVANLVAISHGKYILADLTGNSNNNSWTLQTTELGTSPFKVTLSRTYGKPYLDKTPKEIYDAYTAGKYVYLEGNSLLPLTFAEDFGNEKYTISFSGTSKVSEYQDIQVTSFSVINVTPDYSGQWTENYKYNIDAKVLKLNYNISTNEVSGNNPYNSIDTLNNSGQSAVIQLNITNSNNKFYLNQIAIFSSNTFAFQFSNGDLMLQLMITSNSMQIHTLQIINENNIKGITDQSYVAFYTEQALSDKEKKQARDNIGAISSSELVQSDWNQNDTSSPAYVQNRPGGYYSVVNSVNSGTLTTTDFIDLSSEGLTGYAVQKETLNTALQNLNVTAGKTYEISWVDNGQAFSYISEAVDQVKTEGSVTYHDICIFGDTTVNLTAAELIWGKTAKVIILGGNSVATATNTVTNIKVEELNVVKIPKALVESDNIEEFDLSNNYTTTNKGSIKYNYIGTSIHAKETIQSALLGFKDDGSIPQLELFGSMMDTNYKNTTQYLPAGIYSSWVNHSETGDTFIHGMTISHDPNNELLELESKLVDNITEDLTVRGIATPTADNDAVNKKYVDDNKIIVDTTLSDTSTNPVQNKVVKAAIDDLQASIDSKPSAADAVYTATAESTDGVAYTATVSGIDSLTVGASFIMIPNKASTSKAPTLNVNGLGAKPIRRRLSSLTTSLQQGYSTNWIALNKPFTVVYDGTAWVIEGLTKTDGADVYGAVAQATADAKGNNIADTYATIAMLQSLLPKVTTITLTSNWVGDASPYYQDIALSCVTETSIVDLQPTPEQLNSWQDDGLAFTTLSGNGTVRVYVAGGKPSSAISVQVRVQEVTVI